MFSSDEIDRSIFNVIPAYSPCDDAFDATFRRTLERIGAASGVLAVEQVHAALALTAINQMDRLEPDLAAALGALPGSDGVAKLAARLGASKLSSEDVEDLWSSPASENFRLVFALEDQPVPTGMPVEIISDSARGVSFEISNMPA